MAWITECPECGTEFPSQYLNAHEPMLTYIGVMVRDGKSDDDIAHAAREMARFQREFDRQWNDAECTSSEAQQEQLFGGQDGQ